tara:strand:- start:358 stop:582 length:225 start_codon:yes stop_codon:yes gene_type:complete
MTDPRQSGESLAELENKVGLDLLDSMIYHQETIERYLAGSLYRNPNKGFTDGDEVLGELLEIVKQFTEGIDPDA